MDETATIEHMPVQYADADHYIVAESANATTATVFTPDSEVLVHVVRTRTGGWRVEASDHFHFSAKVRGMRWRTVAEVLDAIAERYRVAFTEITDL